MAAKMCIECGREVGDHSGLCPHCGRRLLSKTLIGWAFVVLLILGLLLIIGVLSVK